MTPLALMVVLGLKAAVGPDAAASAEQKPAIRVYVSAGESDLVDPDARDSANDLRDNLRQRRILVVEHRDAADVWVRVDKRHKGPSGLQLGMATGPTTALGIPIEEQVVFATLLVGDYSLEMVGRHTRSWKAAAGQVAKQVEKWINENSARLVARRSKP